MRNAAEMMRMTCHVLKEPERWFSRNRSVLVSTLSTTNFMLRVSSSIASLEA